MTKISQLIVYPIKSCAGVSCQTATVTETGFKLDREWMVVDESGVAVTQREQPRLALVLPSLEQESLLLNAPGMQPFRLAIPHEPGFTVNAELFGETVDTKSVPQEASEWFSEFLGQNVRLVRRDPAFLRRGGVQYPTRDSAPTAFPDNYGLLVIASSSLEDLNKRLDSSVPMNRFRPNIVIDGVSPYDEDYLQCLIVSDLNLRAVNPCYRCSLTTIDQLTGVAGLEPLQKLSQYRRDANGIAFGMYAVVNSGVGSTLHIDQPIECVFDY